MNGVQLAHQALASQAQNSSGMARVHVPQVCGSRQAQLLQLGR